MKVRKTFHIQNSDLAAHAIFTRFPQCFRTDRVVNTGVDLISDQQHYSDKLHPDHQRDQHADRSVDFVVRSEVGDVIGESIRNGEAQQCRHERADGEEPPVVVNGWSEIIDGGGPSFGV